MSSTKSKNPAIGFPERLRALAEAVGGSGKLAEKIGWGPTTITPYLSGKHKPGLDILERIIEATGCDGHWLLTGEGRMFNGNHLAVAEDPTDYKTGPYPDLATREFLLARLESLAEYIKDVWPAGARAPKKRGKTG